VEAGLVERAPDRSDRRRVQLRLLPAGRARAAALEARLDSHAASLLDHLAPDQDLQLAGILAEILANMSQQGCTPSARLKASSLSNLDDTPC
jgi:DNA-binding MarR family transcriptional regulator